MSEEPTGYVRADSLEEAQAKLAAGEVEKLNRPIYVQEELVTALTLDQKQAWILLTLLGPYREATPDQWDIYRAAWDIRRRLAEAMGYE